MAGHVVICFRGQNGSNFDNHAAEAPGGIPCHIRITRKTVKKSVIDVVRRWTDSLGVVVLSGSFLLPGHGTKSSLQESYFTSTVDSLKTCEPDYHREVCSEASRARREPAPQVGVSPWLTIRSPVGVPRMTDDRYISILPNGVTVGGAIALILGFIPLVNIFGAFIGGVATSYIEESPILKSMFYGGVVGVISLAPWVLYTILGVGVAGGGGDSAIPLIGALGGLFGGLYGLLSLFLAPIAGASGGLSLGVYFHLIYKASD